MANLKCPRCKGEFKTEEDFKSNKHLCVRVLAATNTYELILALYDRKYIN